MRDKGFSVSKKGNSYKELASHIFILTIGHSTRCLRCELVFNYIYEIYPGSIF